uniref:Uncharacterized protein n=1 Tax=Octopus bimaculoides TaxID=37653 RepID=A0A0L8G4Q5_OCTBM
MFKCMKGSITLSSSSSSSPPPLPPMLPLLLIVLPVYISSYISGIWFMLLKFTLPYCTYKDSFN